MVRYNVLYYLKIQPYFNSYKCSLHKSKRYCKKLPNYITYNILSVFIDCVKYKPTYYSKMQNNFSHLFNCIIIILYYKQIFNIFILIYLPKKQLLFFAELYHLIFVSALLVLLTNLLQIRTY